MRSMIMKIGAVLLLMSGFAFSQSKSLSFNTGDTRDEYVIYQDTTDIVHGEDWTIECWVKFANFDAPGNEDHIIRVGAQLFVDSNNNLKAQAGGTYVSGSTTLETDVWYHIAYVRTATEVTVYLNGVSEIVAAGADDKSTLKRLLIGSYGEPNTSYNLAGLMDEVRLWDYALTEEEINENKDVELTGSEDSLVIYYNFNNIQDTTVADISGSNDGVMHNMDSSNFSKDTPIIEPPVVDEIVGQWDFEDSTAFGKATIGEDLLIFGNPKVTSGPKEGDGAVLVGLDDYFKAVTNIKPNGSGKYVNTYTFQLDFKMDALDWNNFLQPKLDNSYDGSLFVTDDGRVGKGSIGYSGNVITAGEWYRLIMVAEGDSASGKIAIDLYLNGELLRNCNPQDIDGRYSLKDSVLFFRDDGGEEMPTDVSQVVLYNYALTSEEIAALGGAGEVAKEIVGQWTFDDSTNVTAATVGSDLELVGTVDIAEGPEEGDGAVNIGIGSHFIANPDIKPDGSDGINTYTMVMDIMFDTLPLATGYSALLQTNEDNSSDGDLFVTKYGTLGSSAVGYSNPIVKAEVWYRLVYVRNAAKQDSITNDFYLNGEIKYNGSVHTSLGGRMAMEDTVLFFADNDGEDEPLNVAKVELYNYAMSADQVALLGGFKDVIEPEKMSFLVPPHALSTTKVSMTADTATSKSGGIEYKFVCSNPDHSSDWQSSQTYVDSTLEMNTEYVFTVTARNDNGTETIVSDEVSVKTDFMSDVGYAEVDGKCVMEAEKASVKANGDFAGWEAPFSNQVRWTADTTGGGYAGTGYMTTAEGVALNASWENGTELAWEVEINTAGEYYIAVRRNSNGNGGSDSAKPGVDGEEKSESTFWGQVTEFTWARCTESLGTLSAGTHTIQIRRREDGFMIDRVMIAMSLDSLPAEGSTEIGPNETLKPKDELPLPEDGTELLVNNYFDDGLNSWEENSNGGSSLNLDETGVLEGDYSAHIRVDSLYEPYESGSWRVQFRQKNVIGGVKAGKKYFVQFQIKSSKAIETGTDGQGFTYTIVEQHGNWDPLEGCKKVIAIPANETITVRDTLECSVTDSLVLFSFDLGNIYVDSVDIWIDAVHLMELDITDGIRVADKNIIKSYSLEQNYPNPFNPTTTINFSIPVAGKTLLTVYNVLGQKIATLINGDLSAGLYKYKFDASKLSSGIYFYELRSKNYSKIMKMMLIK